MHAKLQSEGLKIDYFADLRLGDRIILQCNLTYMRIGNFMHGATVC